jgi:hypothetical protein
MVSLNGQPSLRSEKQDFGLEAEVTEQVTQTSAPSVVCFPLLHYSAALPLTTGARGGAVGWGTALQVGRSRVRFPMVSLDFFH